MVDTPNTSSNIYRIDPLKGTENYAVWKIKMTDILTDLGYIDFIDSNTKEPDTAEAKADWKAKDRKTLSTIRLRVGDAALVYIAGSKSAKEAWSALQSMFEARGAIGTITMCCKLFRAQCEDGTNIEEHIQMLKGLVEELAALGLTISDADFAITLLTSLPDSWDAFISSIVSSTLKESHLLITHILEERSSYLRA